MSNDPMVEEFFGELNDKYYPQILEGLELLDSAEVEQGIETLARPLHTIKGVTGFMAGFEEGSTYTHRVEDYLKKLQAGDLHPTEDNILLASRAVNMVFAVLEQLREYGEVRAQEPADVLALVNAMLEEGPAQDQGGCGAFSCEVRDGVALLKVPCMRIHLTPDRDRLIEELGKTDTSLPLLLDLSGVETMNSATWAEIAALALERNITVACLSQACRTSLCCWGFDQNIAVVRSTEEYFQSRGAGQ